MAEDSNKVTVILRHPVTVSNVKETKEYQPNVEYTLPKEIADDVMRIDREHSNYEGNLVKQNIRVAPVGTDPLTGKRMSA